jgi:hypothetical protein
MSEEGYQQVESEETRRLLRSFGYWDLVVLGALLGAGLGFLYRVGGSPRERAGHVLVGMAIGAMVVLVAGYALARSRAHKRFFARWAAERGWQYSATGMPFEDTPILHSGDRRKGCDFFSGFWPAVEAVLYQHQRIVGSGRDEQVTRYVVLHVTLARPVIDLLQIWPHSVAADLAHRLVGHDGEIGERVELESTELEQHFRISALRGQEDEARRLLTPSTIVRLLEFERALPGAGARFEVVGARAAFLVERTLSPKEPELIERLLGLWRPLADWLAAAAGVGETDAAATTEPQT